MSFKKILLGSACSLTMVVGLGIMQQAAEACGGFFCSLSQPVDQLGERILFVKDGEDIVAHVQIQFTGNSENFSWVVPVPSEPKLGVGSDALFQALQTATQPTFQLNLTTEGKCKPDPIVLRKSQARLLSPGAVAEADDGVTIVSREEIGPFDTVVLTGDDPEKLKSWLRDNGYDIPETLDPLLNPYIEKKMFLVALKLLKDRESGDLQPIVMRYKSEKPEIPIRLTAVAAQPDMDVYAWILGQHRAIPANYKHAEINEARIDWLNRGSNYRQVVTEAINESGGRGFVTNYAGDNTVVDLSTFNTDSATLKEIQESTDPITFIRLITRLNYFPSSPTLVAFLKRHIPKPKSLKDIDDTEFYRFMNRYAEELEKEQIVVDTTKAMNELEETVIKPFNEIKRLFSNNPYLTSLFSTISPEEMTVDPRFEFNTQMEKVSNKREADGVIQCNEDIFTREAPVKITLKNKVSFVTSRLQGTKPEILALPAAARVVQLSTTGEGVVETDNQSKISDSVSKTGDKVLLINDGQANLVDKDDLIKPTTPPGSIDETGTSCACQNPNEPQPFSKGAGEGATYLALFMGWMGFKRKKKNT